MSLFLMRKMKSPFALSLISLWFRRSNVGIKETLFMILLSYLFCMTLLELLSLTIITNDTFSLVCAVVDEEVV